MSDGDGELSWVAAEGGYSLALQGKTLVCRNAKGAVLKSVPSKVRKGERATELLEVRDWLLQHQATCRERVERWLLRSLPVPWLVLEAVWADPAWRGLLQHLVVAAYRAGQPDPERVGFLLGVDPARGCGVVTLDGETEWLQADQLALPHPILLEDLADYREFAGELGYEQGLDQLFRETFTPDPASAKDTSYDALSGGKFAELRFAVGRTRSRGFRVRGGYVSCPVWEGGRMVEARYWIGIGEGYEETSTGELIWVDAEEQPIALGELGPVAYSEGVRMASVIYAGRTIEDRDGGE